MTMAIWIVQQRFGGIVDSVWDNASSAQSRRAYLNQHPRRFAGGLLRAWKVAGPFEVQP